MYYRRFVAVALLVLIPLMTFGKDYVITEDELKELEQILLDFEKYKTEAEKALRELGEQLAESRRLMKDLEVSFQLYEAENRAIMDDLMDENMRLRRNRWIERGVVITVIVAYTCWEVLR